MTPKPDAALRAEPSMRLALWLAFGLGLATLALSTYSLLTNTGIQLLEIVGLVSLIVTALTPFIMSLAASVITARDLKRSPEPKPIQHYVFRTVRQFRHVLTVDIALMPAIVVVGLYEVLHLPLIFINIVNCLEPCPSSYTVPHLPDNVIGQTMGFLFLVFGLWGMCLLLPTLSAVLARRTHNATVATAGSWISWAIVFYVLINANAMVNAWIANSVTQIVLAALPYLLTALIILLAQPDPKPVVPADSKQTS